MVNIPADEISFAHIKKYCFPLVPISFVRLVYDVGVTITDVCLAFRDELTLSGHKGGSGQGLGR